MRPAILVSLWTLLLPGSALAPSPGGKGSDAFDWGVAYYMSYDNDLDVHALRILASIRDGVRSKRTVAAVQADFRGPGGMHRFVIRDTGVDATRVRSEDSANEDRFLEYLEWFAGRFRCRRYVVIVLDHGGDLDQMCLDAFPDSPGKHWMSGHVLGEKLRKSPALAGRFSLLFLQQCGRASLENLSSFRGTADYLLASPVPVGAPNTYYTALHEWLGKTPDATGRDVASQIALADLHYSTYTCVRGPKLDELPGRLAEALQPFLDQPHLVPPASPAVIDPHAGTVDAEDYLTRLAQTNAVGEREVASFLRWMTDDLLVSVWSRGPRGVSSGRHHGLSIAPLPAGRRPSTIVLPSSRTAHSMTLGGR